MKLRKRIATFGAAMVMAVSMMSIGVSAYYPCQNWDVKLGPGLPTSIGVPKCTRSFKAYAGGYKTYCSSISGSNDRKVTVSPGLGTQYDITTTGYSVTTTSFPMTEYVIFVFRAKGSVTCYANGSVGYDL